MQTTTRPNPPPVPLARRKPVASSRPDRPRTTLRPRHLEAHAVAWLRSLRDRAPVRP